ncbi:4Fe-4S cluster-binding domain-containing protein [Candidatus Thorarchaeota archaeon]|nr:MAG: 4Fe-4S cluster-binding domain-containing protein [Candidatus Thorarchaeota archaeon]
MWRVIRPDSLRVWKDPEVVRRLARYRAIIDNERLAKYLIAKKFAFGGDLSLPTPSLWDLHTESSSGFEDFIARVDANEIDISEVANPPRNLLDLKIELANRILADCHFCERRCGADRTKDEKGWCKLGAESRVSSAFLHTGEEAPLVPSGTIFFSSCCFGCVFCQNADISTNPNSGHVVSPEGLAAVAAGLHRDGALNINYVGGDPIPNTHTILESLFYQTSNVTQLWNSNLYCSEETMSLLTDVFDVWLPDFKYGNNECAERLSGVKDYFDIVSRNHLLAYNSGEVIIRHLVMPNHIECCTIPILEWVAEKIPHCIVNIMGQYRPEHRARSERDKFPDIARRVSLEEMQLARAKTDELGICWRPVD